MSARCPACGSEWHVLRNASEALDKLWEKTDPAFCPGCGARIAPERPREGRRTPTRHNEPAERITRHQNASQRPTVRGR